MQQKLELNLGTYKRNWWENISTLGTINRLSGQLFLNWTTFYQEILKTESYKKKGKIINCYVTFFFFIIILAAACKK